MFVPSWCDRTSYACEPSTVSKLVRCHVKVGLFLTPVFSEVKAYEIRLVNNVANAAIEGGNSENDLALTPVVNELAWIL